MTVSIRIYVHRYDISHLTTAFNSRLYAYEHPVKSGGHSLLPMEMLHFDSISYINILGFSEMVEFDF